jgi:ATP-grasp domain, R2K clade family 3
MRSYIGVIFTSMQLLFPSDPFNKSAPDDTYGEEFEAARASGLTCLLFSFEEFEAGQFKTKPFITANEAVLYRGWMVTPENYTRLHSAICDKGGLPKTNPTQYRHCHYLPEWYSICKDFTPETIFAPRNVDFVATLAGNEWSAYFVKDYVKSLTTQRGSVAKTPQEIAEVVSLIEQYRGSIEGGVCIREFEQLIPETEERYFVFNGQAHARDGNVPEQVHEIAKRIQSPFFSVDLVSSASGDLRLIELGDGQVSDRKKWVAEQFISMFNPKM